MKIKPLFLFKSLFTETQSGKQTDTHTDRHFVKTTVFVSGNPKTDISTKISKSNFWKITILPLYYIIWEKEKIAQGQQISTRRNIISEA